jgi:hypothetical protein
MQHPPLLQSGGRLQTIPRQQISNLAVIALSNLVQRVATPDAIDEWLRRLQFGRAGRSGCRRL